MYRAIGWLSPVFGMIVAVEAAGFAAFAAAGAVLFWLAAAPVLLFPVVLLLPFVVVPGFYSGFWSGFGWVAAFSVLYWWGPMSTVVMFEMSLR